MSCDSSQYHSECLGCKDRKANARAINTHQACVVTTATGSKDAERSKNAHAVLKGTDPMLALPPAPLRERTAVDDLVDKYKGVDAIAILDDLEKIKTGSNEATLDKMEEKRKIHQEEEKEKEREKQRLEQRREDEKQSKKDLVLAKKQAAAVEEHRKRKREVAQDRIAQMLAEDEAKERIEGTAESTEAPKAVSQDEETRRKRKEELLQQAEELRLKQEELKKKKEAEEEERRTRMRERRKKNLKAAEVVLDD